jgi:hypothetical protein
LALHRWDWRSGIVLNRCRTSDQRGGEQEDITQASDSQAGRRVGRETECEWSTWQCGRRHIDDAVMHQVL